MVNPHAVKIHRSFKHPVATETKPVPIPHKPDTVPSRTPTTSVPMKANDPFDDFFA